MSKKRVEREIRAAHRRHKKEKQRMGDDFDDFSGLNTQLGILGLTLKQIPGKVANEIVYKYCQALCHSYVLIALLIIFDLALCPL